MDEQKAQWCALREMADECSRCILHFGIKQKVFGSPRDWDGERAIVFIGEAPGEKEDDEGIPFVGPSGKYLRQMIEWIGLEPHMYAILNTVQCRPPENRDPSFGEIEKCKNFLWHKLRLLNPNILVPLGKPACCTVFDVGSYSILANAAVEKESQFRRKSDVLRLPAFPLPHPRWGMQNRTRYKEMFGKLDDWLIMKGISAR